MSANFFQVSSPNVCSSMQHEMKKKEMLRKFMRKLAIVRSCARTIGAVHSLSRFLGVINLTWTMTVVLGAFANTLKREEFVVVVILLFLEASRLAWMSLSWRSVTDYLCRESTPQVTIPTRFQTLYAKLLHFSVTTLYTLVQLALIAPALFLPVFFLDAYGYWSALGVFPITIWNLSFVRDVYHKFGPDMNDGLALAISISLVSLNAYTALIQHILHALTYFFGRMHFVNSSILMYFRVVLKDAMSLGPLNAHNFDILSFIYGTLAEDLRNDLGKEVIVRRHEELIRCLSYTGIGVESLITFINDRDPYVQLAALTIAEIWAEHGWRVANEEEKLELPDALLETLMNRIGTGELGKTAAKSVMALSTSPEIVQQILSVRNSDVELLPGRLVRLLTADHSYALPILRTLAILYDSLQDGDMQRPPRFYDPLQTLDSNLRRVFRDAQCQRVRTCAAFVMEHMGYEITQSDVNSIKPKDGEPWLECEKRLLQKLRIAVRLHQLEDDDFEIENGCKQKEISKVSTVSRIGKEILLLLGYLFLNLMVIFGICILCAYFPGWLLYEHNG